MGAAAGPHRWLMGRAVMREDEGKLQTVGRRILIWSTPDVYGPYYTRDDNIYTATRSWYSKCVVDSRRLYLLDENVDQEVFLQPYSYHSALIRNNYGIT
eukprot:7976343-Pyramimonas_sp.AAC.1